MKVRLQTDKGYFNALELFGDGRYIASCKIEPESMKENTDAWIWSVFVNGDLRGKRVGELLMVCALLQAYEMGDRKVGLYVYASNKSARRLYEKVGFQYDREFPILSGDFIPPDEPEPDRYDSWQAHGEWLRRGTHAEICVVPWINDVYEWTMTMHIELTPKKIGELKKRRKELRQLMVRMDA